MAESPLNVVAAEASGALFTVRYLIKEIGLLKTFQVLGDIGKSKALGEPFSGLGPPVDEQDDLSRQQLGSAVLLYRALKRNLDQPEALRLTGTIVEEASVDFLKLNVPIINPKRLLRSSEKKKQKFMKTLGDKFFNADATITIKEGKSVYFSVSRCRFVELLKRVGEPEMAVLFCKGDFRFFNENQPHIRLERPQELSTGGTYCDFQFHFKEGT